MKTLLDKYLGDTPINEFDSEEEIRAYFSRENIEHMFGLGSYDEAEAAAALKAALAEW